MTKPMDISSAEQLAQEAKAWPFQEARKVVQRHGGAAPDKGYALFETGYGPSGLPHIGTFGEVVRTTMVRQAFALLSDVPSRLFCFSDDMDGLRKVPDNIPNKEMVAEHLGKPLTAIPDPFSNEYPSFGHHNNARLRAFLDAFGFDYEFQSSTELYKAGRFDQALLDVLRHYDDIMAIILPTLGPDRRATYSPFLPISPKTGRVLQVPILARDVDAGTLVFEDEDGSKTELPVTGGHCKLQWKVDWAMRWYALGVDYEMSGKDLIDSVTIGGRIMRVLGARPPEGFNYELFLDEQGQKISKSKGNGLTAEEWLTYAPPETLALFMYQKPKAAKRLYFDVIPRTVDDYLSFLERYEKEDEAKRLENPVWHIHNGAPPREEAPISYAMLLNLASACNAEDEDVLWGFIAQYAPEAERSESPILASLVRTALNYYRDFVKPAKRYRPASEMERAALEDLLSELAALPPEAPAEDLQNRVYEVGKRHPFPDLKAWFRALYEVLFGEERGPRMGSFIALYGRENFNALVRRALAGEDLSRA